MLCLHYDAEERKVRNAEPNVIEDGECRDLEGI
jgi:hypothetical protein